MFLPLSAPNIRCFLNNANFRSTLSLINICHLYFKKFCNFAPSFKQVMLHGGVADTLSTLLQVVDFFSSEHVIEMVYYKEVMHYADHTYEWLNQWSLPGIWVGCLFSLGWLRLMRWNVYRLIALALFVFALYAGGFYFL